MIAAPAAPSLVPRRIAGVTFRSNGGGRKGAVTRGLGWTTIYRAGRDEGEVERPDPRDGNGPEWDRPAAVSLLVVMVPVLAVLFVISRLNVAVHACPQDPACNQPMMNFDAWMLDWLPILIFLGSVVITVVLWKRKRQVFWVSLLALILMTVVFVISSLLVSWAW